MWWSDGGGPKGGDPMMVVKFWWSDGFGQREVVQWWWSDDGPTMLVRWWWPSVGGLESGGPVVVVQ